MIELKTRQQLENAIARAKSEAKNLVVRMTNAARMYRVESKTSGNTYTVNFFIRNNRRYGHCSCKAGLNNLPCKHLVAAAALNMSLAERGLLNRKPAVSVG
jgi:tetrahydromethanopterin S-methyltransferase subunit F